MSVVYNECTLKAAVTCMCTPAAAQSDKSKEMHRPWRYPGFSLQAVLSYRGAGHHSARDHSPPTAGGAGRTEVPGVQSLALPGEQGQSNGQTFHLPGLFSPFPWQYHQVLPCATISVMSGSMSKEIQKGASHKSSLTTRSSGSYLCPDDRNLEETSSQA